MDHISVPSEENQTDDEKQRKIVATEFGITHKVVRMKGMSKVHYILV